MIHKGVPSGTGSTHPDDIATVVDALRRIVDGRGLCSLCRRSDLDEDEWGIRVFTGEAVDGFAVAAPSGVRF